MNIFVSHPPSYSDWFNGEHVTHPEPMRHKKILLGKRVLTVDLKCKRVKTEPLLSKNGINMKEKIARS